MVPSAPSVATTTVSTAILFESRRSRPVSIFNFRVPSRAHVPAGRRAAISVHVAACQAEAMSPARESCCCVPVLIFFSRHAVTFHVLNFIHPQVPHYDMHGVNEIHGQHFRHHPPGAMKNKENAGRGKDPQALVRETRETQKDGRSPDSTQQRQQDTQAASCSGVVWCARPRLVFCRSFRSLKRLWPARVRACSFSVFAAESRCSPSPLTTFAAPRPLPPICWSQRPNPRALVADAGPPVFSGHPRHPQGRVRDAGGGGGARARSCSPYDTWHSGDGSHVEHVPQPDSASEYVGPAAVAGVWCGVCHEVMCAGVSHVSVCFVWVALWRCIFSCPWAGRARLLCCVSQVGC